MLGELKAGRYRVDREVARGGMGVILRAYDTHLNRVVALKMLRPDATHDSHLRHRLATEARAASCLSHPGVATVYDYVERQDESFIVYEFVDGRTLRQELAQTGAFRTEEILDTGILLVDAVAAAHEHGITHRDLKPENIMLKPGNNIRWHVKVLDFGLAKHGHPTLAAGDLENPAQTASMETDPGLLVGTVNYMAPEQLEGEPVDTRTDIHAVGLVLYEMATGINPFLGKRSTTTIANILRQEPPSVRASNPSAPPELDRIVLRWLRKAPEARYQSARDLLVDLGNLRSSTRENSIALRPREHEPSLLRRLISFIGESPYRWWELSQMRMILHYLLFIYLGWRFLEWTPGSWGLIVFFAELTCVAVLVTLRGFLLFTGAVYREDVGGHVRRLTPWIRSITVVLVFTVLAMAGIVAASHSILAALLAFFGIMYALAVVWERQVERAAFPEHMRS